MTDWINKLAAEMVPQEDPTMYEKNSQVILTLAGENPDLPKLYKLLSSNGFPILDMKTELKDQNFPINEGDKVQVQHDVVASTNITMKTPVSRYTIAEAVLPAGYMGEVIATTKDTATVNFDANIEVSAVDQSGYIEKVAYYVGTITVNKAILKKV